MRDLRNNTAQVLAAVAEQAEHAATPGNQLRAWLLGRAYSLDIIRVPRPPT